MPNHHPANVRIKRQYFLYLKEAKGQSEASVDAVAKALARFETYTRHRDFKTFHHEQAVAFKRWLTDQQSQSTGERLSKATLYSTLAHLQRFFHWLADKPGYKSRLQYADAEYFRISDKDARIATAHRSRPVPTLEQLRHVIRNMPAATEIEQRNRALIAFIVLTGARDSAAASAKLKHVDVVSGCFYQDAREVKTKFSKTFTTVFFPVGDDLREIVAAWVRTLREQKLWAGDDPLFPKTATTFGQDRQFEHVSLARDHWANATPVRAIFKAAFDSAGLPYYNPHSIRHMLVQMGQRLCQTPESFKAWSQNLGHEGVLTTFYSYGNVSEGRQREIIGSLRGLSP
jgi:integrase/recombinase XerD